MKKMLMTCTMTIVLATLTFWVPGADAYERYNDGCQNCHGAFTGDISPKGSVFPSGDKHNMHRSSGSMNTECNLCHTSGDGRNPFIGSSDGTGNNQGLGCTGCHLADGLRGHHNENDITSCFSCHGSGSPSPENVMPPYYGTVDTDANMPCNPMAQANMNENWTIGDFEGLDNDGDNSYDGNDSDCVSCVATSDVDTTCDNVDDDCDDQVDDDYVVDDTCGLGVCQANNNPSSCDAGVETPCVPGDSTGEDNDCNTIDEDCSGTADDNYIGVSISCGVGECAAFGTTICVNGTEQDSCTPGTPGTEICDTLDNDCNGTPDDGIAPVATTCGVGECSASGEITCVDGQEVDSCVEGTPSAEICDDGMDNDCDDLTDGADIVDCPPAGPCADFVPEDTACGIGECASTGVTTCTDVDGQAEIGDTCVEGNPGKEICDTLDNDCNGTPDDGIAPVATTCGVGECSASGEITCVDGQEVDSCVEGTPSAEICDDGLDNDCSGLIDDDPSCTEPSQTVSGVRTLPEIYVPGECIDVSIDIDVDEANVPTGLIVNEYVPLGWTVSSTSPAAKTVLDGEMNWLFFGNVVDVTIDYNICAPQGDGGEKTFSGELKYNDPANGGAETTETISGATQTSDGCVATGDEVCDGLDNDCNELIDDGIAPVSSTCGVGECSASGEITCVDGQEVDSCVEGTPSAEICDDGLDNDCDGLTDGADTVNCPPAGPCEGFVPENTTCGIGECASTGMTTCTEVNGQAVIGDTCVVGNPGTEICDTLDNDCNGTPDDGIAPVATTCGMGECSASGEITCVNGQEVDSCVEGTPSAEICDDGLDNDCDDLTDGADTVDCPTTGPCEGFVPEDTACGMGECASTGITTCTEADGQAVIGDTCVEGNPGTEICDTLDNDCNGTPDDGIAPVATTCGMGECSASGEITCVNGQEVDSCVEGTPSAEICDDGLDNDCDDLTDDSDDDCMAADACEQIRQEAHDTCPADGEYRNHGKYVSCAAHIVSAAVDQGLIDEECASSIMRVFAHSDIGKKHPGKHTGDKDDDSDMDHDNDDDLSSDDDDSDMDHDDDDMDCDNAGSEEGAVLYADNCAYCHGDDGSGGSTGEDVRGDSAGEISEAIAGVEDMKYLDSLSNDELQSIAGFLCVTESDGGMNDDNGMEDGDDDKDDDYSVFVSEDHPFMVATGGKDERGTMVRVQLPDDEMGQKGDIQLIHARVMDPSDPDYPNEMDLPEGAMVLDYIIQCDPNTMEPGRTVTVIVDIPEGMVDAAAYKMMNGKLEMIGASEGSDNTIRFDITDGGRWDDDNEANWVIVDPVIIASSSTAIVAAESAPASSSSGGGGGCAISKGSDWTGILILLLPVAVLYGLRRSRVK